MEVRKTFLKGINSDDAYYLVDPQEYLGAMNMRYTFSENGEIGTMRTIDGNEYIRPVRNTPEEIFYPEDTLRVVGACTDQTNRRLFYFVKNDAVAKGVKTVSFDDDTLILFDKHNLPATGGSGSGAVFSLLQNNASLINRRISDVIVVDPGVGYQVGDVLTVEYLNDPVDGTYTFELTITELRDVDISDDGVYCLDSDQVVRKVLMSSDVVGGLNFDGDIQSAIIGDMLYWTDDKNDQRRVNVEAGLKAYDEEYVTNTKPYALPVAREVISLIRPMPMLPLKVVKKHDDDYENNFIGTGAFQFAYRFIYRDYEISAFSPLSEMVNYSYKQDDENYIEVSVPEGQNIQQDVSKIEVAVVINGQYRIIKTIAPGGGAITQAGAYVIGGDMPVDGTYSVTASSGNTGSGAEFTIEISGGEIVDFDIDEGGTGYTPDPNRVVWGPLTAYEFDSNGFLLLFGTPNIKAGDVIEADNGTGNGGIYYVTDVEVSGSGFGSETKVFLYRQDGAAITDSMSGPALTVTVLITRSLALTTVIEDVEVLIAPKAVTVATSWQFDFYNDVVGVAVDSASSSKLADDIPIRSKTLEIAKNRLFLGNNYEGYEAPEKTSLTVSLDPFVSSIESIEAKWYEFKYWKLYSTGIRGRLQKYEVNGYYVVNVKNTVDDDGWYILRDGMYINKDEGQDDWAFLQNEGGRVSLGTISAIGSGYIVGDIVNNSDRLQIKITGVDTGGEVLSFQILDSGYGYSTGVVSMSGGSGSGFQFNIAGVDDVPKYIPISKLTKINEGVDDVTTRTQINAFQYHERRDSGVSYSPKRYGFEGFTDYSWGNTSNYVQNWPEFFIGYPDTGATASVSGVDSLLTDGGNTPVFKPASKRFYGTVFYDFAGRPCGVVPNKSPLLVPDREYDERGYRVSATWSLSKADEVNEIPEWAAYYSVVTTKDQTVAAFISDRASDLVYISIDSAGDYSVQKTTYNASNLFGVGVEAKKLFANGLGYSYAEGDYCKLYVDGVASPFNLKVKAQWGNYIVVDLADLGDLTTSPPSADFEIYSPYKALADDGELYYEMGQVFEVLSPGTPDRGYSTVSGKIYGDCYILSRIGGTYLALAMSPNDLFWKNWNRNLGRVNRGLATKPAQKSVSVCFSNTVILGTEINGLSSFESLSETQLPVELGGIQKLHLVSKVGIEGTVMLAIGEQETCSIYLGETQIVDSSGANAFFSGQPGVIGSVNVLRGSFGTINPESVASSQGTVYWFDASRGAVVRYDSNGLTPISRNKMYKFFKRVGQDVLTGNLKMYGGYDPFNDEYLITVPRVGNDVENILLEDMIETSITVPVSGLDEEESVTVEVSLVDGAIYKMVHTIANLTLKIDDVAYDGSEFRYSPAMVITAHTTVPWTVSTKNIYIKKIKDNFYQPYDGNSCVWVFSPAVEKFTSKYTYSPEWQSSVDNRLISFKYGMPYVHSGDSSTLFMQQYDSGIALLINESQSKVNVYHAVSVEGTKPNAVHLRAEIPYVQSSDLVSGDFRTKEGVHYSEIRRDRLSPNVTVVDDSNAYNEKLYKGDRMRGPYLKCMITYGIGNIADIRFVGINVVPSAGHVK